MTKFQFLILILLLLSFNLNAQQKAVEVLNIYWDWQSRMEFRNVKCDTLYYSKNIQDSIIDSTIAVINKTNKFKICNLYKANNNKYFKITKKEKEFILSELYKLKGEVWKDSLLPNSKAIDKTNFAEVFKITKKLATENECRMCSIIYTFSKPIYLRKNKYCLILDQRNYDVNEKQLTFQFLIWERNRWEQYADIYIHFD